MCCMSVLGHSPDTTNTFPALSKVVPQGSWPLAMEKSVAVTPDDCANVCPTLAPTMFNESAKLPSSDPRAKKLSRIFLLSIYHHFLI